MGPNRKADRSRRIWSIREEEILMATLKDLTANGWKSDNGFRNGYLVRAREAIKREFPKTDIMLHPHIYSKITTWKRNYGSLKMMLNHSGIGFNSDGTYQIELNVMMSNGLCFVRFAFCYYNPKCIVINIYTWVTIMVIL